MNTTFTQVIGDRKFVLTVPMSRVEKLVDKVDFLIESGFNDKAVRLVSAYAVNRQADNTPPKVDNVGAIIQKMKGSTKSEVVRALVAAGITKPAAYYHVRKHFG